MATSTDPDHLIYKWGDANNPAAFGGISSVKHNSPTLSLAQIKDQLVELPTYQKYRVAKRPRPVQFGKPKGEVVCIFTSHNLRPCRSDSI